MENDEENELRCLTTIVDITERKLASQALLKAQIKLEKKVKEKTASLKQANLELKLENQERKTAERALKERQRRFLLRT